jgi:hypothetical protein
MGVVMFRKLTSIFMLSFICMIEIGCCLKYSEYNKKDINTAYLNHKLKNQKNSPLHNQNFIFLTKFIMTKDRNDYNEICYTDTENKYECIDPFIPLISASGYIVKTDKRNNTLYALSAAHWCEQIKKEELYDITDLLFEKKPLIGSFVTYMGSIYRLNQVIIDSVNDLCLIKFKSKYANYAKNIKITKDKPVIGDQMHAISAPQWSYEDEIRQHYTGKFAGCTDYECMFTLPATYGSSGSAVINDNGEIVSIISKSAVDFNNYMIGPSATSIRVFLEENL